MKEFLIAIHRDITSSHQSPSAEEMKEAMQPYKEWIADIARQDRLVFAPQRWDTEGRVISTAKKVHEGAYAEGVISIGGFFVLRANNYDEAVTIAKECPIIKFGAIVEVRMAIPA
jgi:hypothetical protein